MLSDELVKLAQDGPKVVLVDNRGSYIAFDAKSMSIDIYDKNHDKDQVKVCQQCFGHFSSNSYTCTVCGGNLVNIDINIAPAIIALWKLGIETVYCCEGHAWQTGAPYVWFRANRKFSLKYLTTVCARIKAKLKLGDRQCEIRTLGKIDFDVACHDTKVPMIANKLNFLNFIYKVVETFEREQNADG